MCRLGAARERIAAAIGPCIAQRSYEVGPEFPRPFLEQDEANADLFAPPGHSAGTRPGHLLFDLAGYVARRLARVGIDAVGAVPCDTCREEERFFSYRRATLRGETDYGRNLSAIALEQ